MLQPNFLANLHADARQELHELGFMSISRLRAGDSVVLAWITDGEAGEYVAPREEVPPGKRSLVKTRDFLYFLQRTQHNTQRSLSGEKVLVEAVLTKDVSSQRLLTLAFEVDLKNQSGRIFPISKRNFDWFRVVSVSFTRV